MQPKKQLKFNTLAFLKKQTLFIDQKCTSKKRAKKFGHGQTPPLIWAMPERKRFFLLMSSLRVQTSSSSLHMYFKCVIENSIKFNILHTRPSQKYSQKCNMWRPTMAWSVRATRITQGRFHQDHNHRTCKLQLLGNKNEMCSSSILSEYVFANGKSPCSNHPEHNHKHTSILWKIQRKGRLFYKLMPLRQNIFHIPTI